mmetsp:Transcript_31981/g.39224  ORF Transcript_31981/g.39224 Transcript_31981/m.39224 type:complete len:84 (+) Transcript_31981:64-315(+)
MSWIGMYNKLKKFQLRQGHCNIPKVHKKYFQLAIWITEQRKQYKLMSEGKVSVMTKEKKTALENIGFQWNLNVAMCSQPSRNI